MTPTRRTLLGVLAAGALLGATAAGHARHVSPTVRWTPPPAAVAPAATDPTAPGLAPGQCYTFPVQPDLVVQTVCRHAVTATVPPLPSAAPLVLHRAWRG